jgi:hypothetical protein
MSFCKCTSYDQVCIRASQATLLVVERLLSSRKVPLSREMRQPPVGIFQLLILSFMVLLQTLNMIWLERSLPNGRSHNDTAFNICESASQLQRIVARRFWTKHSFRADRLQHILARHSKNTRLAPPSASCSHASILSKRHVTTHTPGFEPWELHTTTPTQARYCRAALRAMHNLADLRSSDHVWGFVSIINYWQTCCQLSLQKADTASFGCIGTCQIPSIRSWISWW